VTLVSWLEVLPGKAMLDVGLADGLNDVVVVVAVGVRLRHGV